MYIILHVAELKQMFIEFAMVSCEVISISIKNNPV